MKFIGPEEGGIVAVLRTPGPGLVGIFTAGASPSDVASPSKGGGEGEAVGTVAHKGVASPRGPLLTWVSLVLYIFHVEIAVTLTSMTPTFFL
jgi:hypothetical protein